MARELGRKQKGVLRSLYEHRRYHPGCSWVWDTHSGTVRVLEGLKRRGLVVYVARSPTLGLHGVGEYRLTTDGEALAVSLGARRRT